MTTSQRDAIPSSNETPTLDELLRVVKKAARDYRDSVQACDSPALAKFRVERRVLAAHLEILAEMLPGLLEDAARLEWISDNACTVSDGYGPDGELMHPFDSTHGRVMLLERTLPTVPRETKDWFRAAIDSARSGDPSQ